MDSTGEVMEHGEGGSGENTSSRLNYELHPLENHEILKRVFRHCTLETLKNCRLVGSKPWLDISLKFWRENVALRVCPSSSTSNEGIPISELKEIYAAAEEEGGDVLQLERRPFRNLKFRGFRKFVIENPEVTWFLEKFSENISRLTLMDCEFSTLKSFLDLILLKLPKLEELKLMGHITFRGSRQDGIDSYPEHLQLRTFVQETISKVLFPLRFPWEQLFKNTIALEDLRLNMKYGGTEEELRQIMRAIDIVRQEDNRKMNIRNLEIMSVNADTDNPITFGDIVEYRPGEQIPLERFTGAMIDMILLEPYSSTVELLHIIFAPAVEIISLDRLEFSQLKEFHSNGKVTQIFKNLGRCEAPKLETIIVDAPPRHHNTLRVVIEPVSLQPHFLLAKFENVLRFECNNSFCQFAPEDIELLARSMPSLIHLVMPLTSKTFPIVCSEWKNLRTLTTIWSFTACIDAEVNDVAITGINPDQECSEMERAPNITDLEFLTSFANPYELTDLSVYHGFLKLQRLVDLNVNLEKISGCAKMDLQLKLKNLKY